jgi:hypothetical protein
MENFTRDLIQGDLLHNVKIFIEHVTSYNSDCYIMKNETPSSCPCDNDYVTYCCKDF